MWKNKEKVGCHKIDTLISQKTRIVGDVHFSGGLHIDGVVQGNVIAEDISGAILTIGDKGHIEGEVHVPDVIVNGTVIGDVYATSKVELSTNAAVSGNVYYNLIKMMIGAKVNGNLINRSEEPVALTQDFKDPALLEVKTHEKLHAEIDLESSEV